MSMYSWLAASIRAAAYEYIQKQGEYFILGYGGEPVPGERDYEWIVTLILEETPKPDRLAERIEARITVFIAPSGSLDILRCERLPVEEGEGHG